MCRGHCCFYILFTGVFVFSYNLTPPFELTKFTYPDMQPQNMLLRPHKVVVLSQLSKPNGPRKIKIKLKPPKYMSTKWFFQSEFSEAGLALLQASAASFTYPSIGPKAQNQMVTLYYLDTTLYNHPSWAAASTTAWKPLGTYTSWVFHTKTKTPVNKIIKTVMPPTHVTSPYTNQYQMSISREYGWWSKPVLNAYKVTVNGDTQQVANRPIYTARYNPNEDTGDGNIIYAVSLLQSKWTPPETQTDLVIAGQPLWMGLYGLYSFFKLHPKR